MIQPESLLQRKILIEQLNKTLLTKENFQTMKVLFLSEGNVEVNMCTNGQHRMSAFISYI